MSRDDDYADREGGIVAHPSGVSADNEVGADPGGGLRVFRGGSFELGARGARSANRSWFLPVVEWQDLGFRVLLPAAPNG